MKINGNISNLTDSTVTVTFYGDHAKELEQLRGKVLDVELKEHREKRSIGANALCWELCSQIGKALTPPISKEEVYRSAIEDVGVFKAMYIKREEVEDFERIWTNNGVGWFIRIVGNYTTLPGHVEILAFIGSSLYDSKAMSTLIDYLVVEAQQMELPIGHDLEEIERIKNDYALMLAE